MQQDMNASVLLAAESLAPGNGGICRVARLMARVISEELAAGRVRASGLALNGAGKDREFAFPVADARNSRIRFAARCHLAAAVHTHLVFDFEGMARARPRLPGLRRRWMVWIHGIEVWEGAQPKRPRTAREADFLLANSQYTKDRASRAWGGFEHARVCWLATEHDDPPTRAGPCRQRPTVLIIGRMDRYKGHEPLIDCWPRVVSAVPDARLLIVGRGDNLDRFRQQAAAGPACEAIEFMGFVPDEQMESVWAQATVFAMPSRGEGFGLVYIEAMRYGLPVIASIHDAAPEVNVQGETGFNVDLEKPNELLDRIIDLLRNPPLAAQLGQAGQRRWSEHFRYTAFRQRFRPLLQQFVES